MIKKLFVTVALVLLSATTFAENIDTSNLNDSQRAELKSLAAKAQAENAKASAAPTDAGITLGKAASWGKQAAEASQGFAVALGIAARELGVTVNDFLHTDAGKLTAAVIVWKLVGVGLLKSMFGIVVFITGLSLVRVLYTRLFTKGFQTVEYSRFGGFFKGTKLLRVPKSISDLNNDGEWLVLWMLIIVTVATVGISAVIIF